MSMLILILVFIHPLMSSLLDSGCFGKVCKESHCALQRWPGSAEPDGLHPERGALANSTYSTSGCACVCSDPTSHRSSNWSQQVVYWIWTMRTQPETTELYVLCYFGLGECFHHDRQHVTYSPCTLWVSSSDVPIPSALTGTLVGLGFPMGEGQTGRMYSTEHDHVSKYIPALGSPLSLPFMQFKCCGWNNYTDWSWNLYFNCTHENPSSERCAVPYSCCTPVPGEVRAFLRGLIA